MKMNEPFTSTRSASKRSRVETGRVRVKGAAEETRRRWARATWFGTATYVAWSPFTTVNKLLPAGTTTRGVVLTLIPLVGAIAVLRLPIPEKRRRLDLLVGFLAVLVAWQAISVDTEAGTNYFLHVIPSVMLLVLAAAARGPVGGMLLVDIRFAIAGILPPLLGFLALGWIAQFAHLAPSTSPSAIPLSIHGYRLQGLGAHPNNFGFLAAIVTLVAFAASPGRLSWITRAVGALSLLASDSRTSIIVLGTGLFALWVFGPGRDLTKRMAAFAFLAIAAIGAWGVIDVQRQANTDILSDRDVVWRDLLPYLHHLPLFGYGPNIFVSLAPQVFGPYTPYGEVLDAQNQWLSDSIEFGLLASILLTLCLIVIPLRGSTTYRRLLLFPLLGMVLVECVSEVPLAVFSSIDGVFPLFLLVMLAPLRDGALRPSVLRKPFVTSKDHGTHFRRTAK
jgi:O-Antigen ligase